MKKLLRWYRQRFQIVVSPVENVQVYLLLDARQLAAVGVLPEGPRPLVAHAVHVVVGNPVGVEVEHGVVHILLAEAVIGVEDGPHAVVLLHACQPFEDALPEVLGADALRPDFHVEHGWQVARLQLHIADEVLGLLLRRRRGAIEMIGATHDAVFPRPFKVLPELRIHDVAALGGLDEGEDDGVAVDGGAVAQQLPVDAALMVAHVDAVHGVALRSIGIVGD